MKTQKGVYTREVALGARPLPLPLVDCEEMEDGGARLTVTLKRPRWQQVLGAPEEFDRTYELDAYGREVYEACDGQRRVAQIARAFASAHRISRAEAEMSVTAYLKTLIAKGLIAMAVGRNGK